MPKTLTVFTPTYNRGYKIKDLYDSLVAQTCDDFTWLVVDDGSTDDTRSLIEGWRAEGKVDIEYIWQENGGKQRAYNTGVQRCDGELFFTIDSDDLLVPDAVEAVLARWAEVRDDPGIVGVLAMQGIDADTPMHDPLPHDLRRTTVWGLWYHRGCKGDVALIYRTDVLRRHPFVVEPNEKFIGETYVYFQMDDEGDLAVLDKVLWIAAYLPDGYTRNVRRVARENPVGYMRLKWMYIERARADGLWRLEFESTILYLVAAHFAGRFGEGFRRVPNRLFALIAVPGAWLLWSTEFQR